MVDALIDFALLLSPLLPYYAWRARPRHHHQWIEWCSGVRADGPNGALTVQCIHWTCDKCHKTIGDKTITLFLCET